MRESFSKMHRLAFGYSILYPIFVKKKSTFEFWSRGGPVASQCVTYGVCEPFFQDCGTYSTDSAPPFVACQRKVSFFSNSHRPAFHYLTFFFGCCYIYENFVYFFLLLELSQASISLVHFFFIWLLLVFWELFVFYSFPLVETLTGQQFIVSLFLFGCCCYFYENFLFFFHFFFSDRCYEYFYDNFIGCYSYHRVNMQSFYHTSIHPTPCSSSLAVCMCTAAVRVLDWCVWRIRQFSPLCPCIPPVFSLLLRVRTGI